MNGTTKVIEVGSLLAAGYGLYQSNRQHRIEVDNTQEKHRAAMELASKQHKKDMEVVKQTYLLQLFSDLEQHFHQLNADLIASTREGERDMYDQRNQGLQTIILASSVMFAALSTLLVEGELPGNASEFMYVGFALFAGLSFSLLFLCIVISIEVTMRSSKFMYQRAERHTRQLQDAMKRTKDMMKNFRGENLGNEQLNRGTTSDRDAAPTVEELSPGLRRESSRIHPMRRIISQMEGPQVEREWMKHEQELQKYLSERAYINDQAELLIATEELDAKTAKQISFEIFWGKRCKVLAEIVIFLFYSGTLSLLVAILIFMYTQFRLRYDSTAGALIAIGLIGLSIVLVCFIVLVMRIQNHRENLS